MTLDAAESQMRIIDHSVGCAATDAVNTRMFVSELSNAHIWQHVQRLVGTSVITLLQIY